MGKYDYSFGHSFNHFINWDNVQQLEYDEQSTFPTDNDQALFMLLQLLSRDKLQSFLSANINYSIDPKFQRLQAIAIALPNLQELFLQRELPDITLNKVTMLFNMMSELTVNNKNVLTSYYESNSQLFISDFKATKDFIKYVDTLINAELRIDLLNSIYMELTPDKFAPDEDFSYLDILLESESPKTNIILEKFYFIYTHHMTVPVRNTFIEYINKVTDPDVKTYVLTAIFSQDITPLLLQDDGNRRMLDILMESECKNKVDLLNKFYTEAKQTRAFRSIPKLAYISYIYGLIQNHPEEVRQLLTFILTTDLTTRLIAADKLNLLIDILVHANLDEGNTILQSYLSRKILNSSPEEKSNFLASIGKYAEEHNVVYLRIVQFLLESELSLFLSQKNSWSEQEFSYLENLTESILPTYMDILQQFIVANFAKIPVKNRESLNHFVELTIPINEIETAKKNQIIEFIKLNSGNDYVNPVDLFAEQIIAATEKVIKAADDSLKTSTHLPPSNVLVTNINPHHLQHRKPIQHIIPESKISHDHSRIIIKPSLLRRFMNKWKVLPFEYKLAAGGMVILGLATLLLGVFLPPSLAFTLPALKLSGSTFLSILGGSVIGSTLVGHACHIQRQNVDDVIFPNNDPSAITTQIDITAGSSLENFDDAHEETLGDIYSYHTPHSSHSRINTRLAESPIDANSLSLHDAEYLDSKKDSLHLDSDFDDVSDEEYDPSLAQISHSRNYHSNSALSNMATVGSEAANDDLSDDESLNGNFDGLRDEKYSR